MRLLQLSPFSFQLSVFSFSLSLSMKKFALTIIVILSFVPVKAQNEEAFTILETRGEIYFSFSEKERAKIDSLSAIISIDKTESKPGRVYAYANREEFIQFLNRGYACEIIPPHKDLETKSGTMAATVEEMQHHDKYPTYPVYLDLMKSFRETYSDLCTIDTIGYSVNNRLILSARITNDRNNANPKFFYSSTMHGDEVTGFVLMLRLIEHLLFNYGKDEKITRLVNTVDIYINPNANPDGTYPFSDSTVFDAKRYNANRVDLNRNYPDPFRFEEILIQPENEAMINYAEKHRFTLAANIHGGAEIVNFPWDSYTSPKRMPADSTWWKHISKQFVDTCRTYNPSSFSDTDPSGITYGGDWYTVAGGRQDFMNASLNIRELTLEISSEKILRPGRLPDYWEFQHRSLLNYIEQAAFGIHGKVTDSATDNPIPAKVFINNHDDQYSFIYGSPSNGHFFRPMPSGKYDISFSADGYTSKTVKNISVEDFASTFVSVRLGKDSTISLNPTTNDYLIYPNPATNVICIEHPETIKEIDLYNSSGQKMEELREINLTKYNLNISHIRPGIYILRIQTKNDNRFRSFVKQNPH